MDIDADKALRDFFDMHRSEVEAWFNIISPQATTIDILKADLHKLTAKAE